MSRPAHTKFERPSRLGDYFVCCQLGEGGFGTVYLAFDAAAKRSVALKLPRRNWSDPATGFERFLREAQNLEGLQHPGIVPVYEAGYRDGVCFIALRYVEGTTLADSQARKRLALPQIAALIAEVCDALEYAHSRGVVHRDIKPSNILLDLEDRAYLTDFGLAAWEGEPLADWIRNAGTPEYLSPEQVTGRQADRRSDVYSLGLVFYELLSGHRAFRADSVAELLALIRDIEPVPPRTLRQDVPRDLEQICLKAIAKAPEQRYPSAGAMAAELRAAVRTLAERANLTTSANQPTGVRAAPPVIHSNRPVPVPQLQVLKGPNVGAIISLEGDRFTFGRNPECAVVIPLTSVSREHAQILRVGGKYFIEDLRSRNSTFVNNAQVTNRTALKNNDRIRICDFIAAFLEQAAAAPEEDPEEEYEGPSTVEAMLNHASHMLLDTQPAEKLRLLIEINGSLSRTLELDVLLPKIADSLFQVFKQAGRCFLVVAEGEGTGAKFVPRVVKSRRPADVANARFSKSIVRKCLEEGKAFLSDDATRDDRVQLSQSVVDFRIRSVMCAPLSRADGRGFGVIQLDTEDRSKKFTQEDLKLLCAVANQASIALENIRLHEEALKQQVEKVIEQRNMALTTVHSLRQPIMAIHGALMRVEYDLAEDQGRQQTLGAVRDAMKSLTRTQEIVTAILRFVRPPKLAPVPADFSALIQATAQSFRELNHGVQLQATVPHEFAVSCDTELIKQAVEELMNNAARSLRGRGMIQVRARKMKLENDLFVVRVEVEDDGPGIAPEIRERLFQPYVTTHAEGKGLGLVFVKYVIEQHGGDVWCEDVGSGGARFVFRLPLSEAARD